MWTEAVSGKKNLQIQKYPDTCGRGVSAFFKGPIFAPLARANERVHVHNERNFPQAKLDSEINARFLLNEHGDLYIFYLITIVYILSSLI